MPWLSPCSPTAAGFTSVSRDHQSPTSDGFGFGENNLVGFVVTAADIPGVTNDDLFRDGVQNGHSTSTFLVQAAAATNYDVRVYLGHAFLTRDNIQVTVEGADIATQTAATTNEFGTRFTSLTFTNADDTNADGFITISFVDNGGSNFGYSINGVDIATASNLPAAATLRAAPAVPDAASVGLGIGLAISHDLATDAGSVGYGATLSTDDLTPLIAIVRQSFLTQLSVTSDQAALLSTATFVIADLSGGVLAELLGHTIYIDDDATGAGWYTGLDSRVSSNKYDLLTALAHELGHLIGLDHAETLDDIMSDSLSTGLRKDTLGAIDNFFHNSLAEIDPLI